jgi:PHD/YefM family antitoxin component YafN of YafNO toxin-antitoxin module
MTQVASSVEVSKAFGRYSRQALREPLTITHHGVASLVMLSLEEYERLKRRDREVLTISDFTAEDREQVSRSRAPDAARAFDDELNS